MAFHKPGIYVSEKPVLYPGTTVPVVLVGPDVLLPKSIQEVRRLRRQERWYLGHSKTGQFHAFKTHPRLVNSFKTIYPTIEGPMLMREAKARQTKTILILRRS